MAQRHLGRVDPEALYHARNRLAETGIARLSFLLPHRVKRMLAAEALTLLDQHRQWGEPLPEGENAARQPETLTFQEVSGHATCIPAMYECEPLRHKLSVIAGEAVLPCRAERRYTVSRTRHDDAGNEWHWDDHAFAFVLVVECPPLEYGGFIQTVAHTRPAPGRAEVYRTLTRNPILSWEMRAGDLYLMRTGTTLHRVHPFEHGRRTVVGMTFASHADIERESSPDRFSRPFPPAVPPRARTTAQGR